jgi:orotate phosphoribosyltransferase
MLPVGVFDYWAVTFCGVRQVELTETLSAVAVIGSWPHKVTDMSDSDRDALLEQITSKAVIHGEVTLSSGRTADYYVDLRRITLDAEAAPLVGRVMLETTADLEFDAVGGLTLGADPVACAMMHAASSQGRHLDAFVVRKAEKQHGLQRRIEGPEVKGRRVLAVEDTSTTGGSVLIAVEALRDAGAEVVGVAVIVDRATGAQANVEAAGLPYLFAYGQQDLGV